MVNIFTTIGANAIKSVHELGAFGIFCLEVVRTCFSSKPRIGRMLEQMQLIGVESLAVVMLTGAAVGGVLAFHSHNGLSKFGATDQFIGPIVFLAMVREFGPVLSALMVTGRAGSAMTAEIGTMQISEQIDALKTLSINLNQYLMVPRVVAATLVMPTLSLFCTAFGVLVGYLISVHTLHINAETYVESIRANVVITDLFQGVIKALVFGAIFSLIGCYKGSITTGGAKGVGKSTTESVVYASVSILIVDYILTSFMSLMYG
jgi:phospholipid/cholesterol/gamma-HCH transport system permease protein